MAAIILAGCSSASGPTFNAYSVKLTNGEPAYRVDCYGLLEGRGTCEKKAREICDKQPVRPIESVAPLGRSSGGQPDTRILTFQCGAPAAAAPEPASQPAAAEVQKKITLDTDTNFDFDRATLTPIARERLDKLLKDSAGITFATVAVSGYTDSIGSDDYNQKLSEQRAATVSRYLQDHGLRANRYAAHGYGKANPVASNQTASGRAQNRRVEVELIQ
ncbi:OmpA family protein [Burkholderia ambifaria]|uniref:OmpA family protein n=1 Tax=Burkholderia ambifaria TaxID=152480 RepID=UPI001E28C748|nr:OmpA family protein [Burkholderia ambifaria]UEP23086.1 OmpA family protein [Burkholderia ambifaria]UEP39831.1 OmpA family protein [Burkholderia ambifaria]